MANFLYNNSAFAKEYGQKTLQEVVESYGYGKKEPVEEVKPKKKRDKKA